ncbi:unnamed protein product [Strongylus vulgaris]|uniref:Uncharacterized protein n=1 Tax=Strongylus vulgaris TaxID=40348 RepID=A0A3P7J566_STRVU|nr:unnamed protein product [Strongylus vulgaris]
MSSQGNRKPVLSASQRNIIKYCIDNAKDDIADRIIRRAVERKEDFKYFLDNLPRVSTVAWWWLSIVTEIKLRNFNTIGEIN